MILHHWKKHAFSAARVLAPLHRYINTHRVLIQHPDTSACSKNSSETDSSTPLYQQCFEIGLHFQTICCIAIVFNNTTIQLFTNFQKKKSGFRPWGFTPTMSGTHKVHDCTLGWFWHFTPLGESCGAPDAPPLRVFDMSKKVTVFEIRLLPAAILCRMHPIPSELGS